MANIGFKTGLQSTLDTLMANKNGTEGCFYLTSDTNRLYIGKSDKSIVAVNEGVITVANLDTLNAVTTKHAGQFYYVTSENILCVYNGQSWIQINAQATTVTNNSLEHNVVTAGTNVNGAKVNTIVTDSANNPVEGSFTITGSGGVVITFNGTTDTVNIDGEIYTIEKTINNGVATITLKGDNDSTHTSSIGIAQGDNITITDSNGNIQIAAKDTKIESAAFINQAGTNGFKLQLNANDVNEKVESSSLDPIIAYGDSKTVHFVNGTATLDVYDKTQVDEIIKNYNAIVYQGTIGDGGASNLPTSEVKNGDAYLIAKDGFSYDGKTYPAGTLAVATGEEGSNGFLTNVEWTFVTGSQVDTTYAGEVIEHGIQLKESTGETAAKLSLAAGTDIVLTDGKTSGIENVVTVAHSAYSNEEIITGAVTTEFKSNTEVTIPVISKITRQNGHITDVETVNYKVKDTQNEIHSDTAYTVTSSDNTATVNYLLKLKATDDTITSLSKEFTITGSDNIKVSKGTNTNAVKLDLVWGTF